MASTSVKSNRMKRTESKTHSWWCESHISPKNSKWLQENLEEMDQHVIRMLKLMKEDADSFARKADMVNQKMPELISLVEGFRLMYRSLANRYDHVIGDLPKNIPSHLQSQDAGTSEIGSESSSIFPSPDRRLIRRKSVPRAAGFKFFLESGSDLDNKEGDESSKSESVGSSGTQNNEELLEVKEESQVQEEQISDGFSQKSSTATEQNQVRQLQESIHGSEAEVLDSVHKMQTPEEELRITQKKLPESEEEVESLRQELTSNGSSIQNLQDQLKSTPKELFVLKNKLEKEKLQVSELPDSIARYKTNLSDGDQEIRGSKEAISNTNKSLSEENEQLQAEITRNRKELDLRCQSLEEDVRRVQAEMEVIFGSQIQQLKAYVADKNECVENLKKNLDALQLKYDMLMAEEDDLNINIAALAAEVSSKDDQIDEMSRHMHQLHMEHVDLSAGAEGARKLSEELRSRIQELEREVERKQEIILEGAEKKREAIRQLCFSLEHYRDGYHRLRQAVIEHKGLQVMAS
ncbi:hypothetical protein Pfo_006886 [Paulownia fortunei]|nr:hypothetical protein Pfo_006886 [Paulownia fortunei]